MEDKWLELIAMLGLNKNEGYNHDDFVMSLFYQIFWNMIDRQLHPELKEWIGNVYTWKRRSEF